MTYVRGEDGQPLICCWDDCERPGHEETKLVRTEGDKKLHYVFCNLTHMAMYEAAPFSLGNVSRSGPRQRSPLGLLLPPGYSS